MDNTKKAHSGDLSGPQDCPQCNNRKYWKFMPAMESFKAVRYFSHQYSYVVCEHCGLIREYPPKTIDMIEEYCKDTYEQANVSCFDERQLGSTVKDFDDSLDPYNSAMVDFIKSHIPQKKIGAVLDVGCRTGSLLAQVKNTLDIDTCHGLEPAASYARFARETYLFDNFFNSRLECADIASNYYDLILSINSIRHFPDPNKSLKIMRDALKENGRIVVVIIALEQRGNRQHGELFNIEELFPAGKFFFYSRKTLENLFMLNGLMVEHHSEILFNKDNSGWEDWSLDGYILRKGDVVTNFDYGSNFIETRDLLSGLPEENTIKALKRINESGVKQVFCFGAGHFVKYLNGLLSKHTGIKISRIFDNSQSLWGSDMDGIPICDPATMFDMAADELWITSYNHMDVIYQQVSFAARIKEWSVPIKKGFIDSPGASLPLIFYNDFLIKSFMPDRVKS